MELGIVAAIVGLATGALTYLTRSRTVSNDEWRSFIDELQQDRDQWRARAIECEQAHG